MIMCGATEHSEDGSASIHLRHFPLLFCFSTYGFVSVLYRNAFSIEGQATGHDADVGFGMRNQGWGLRVGARNSCSQGHYENVELRRLFMKMPGRAFMGGWADSSTNSRNTGQMVTI